MFIPDANISNLNLLLFLFISQKFYEAVLIMVALEQLDWVILSLRYSLFCIIQFCVENIYISSCL